MCGIVGYVGQQDCVPILLKGLSALEYRGYDSAGVAVLENGKMAVRKEVGRLAALEEKIGRMPLSGVIGIGHTRWATHGEPSEVNSHPHLDSKNRIAVIHNGIIENFRELKAFLQGKGVSFRSETDTEVVSQLLSYYYEGDLLKTLFRVIPMLEGSYALGILCQDQPEHLYCVRNGSPLIIGRAKGEFYVASDISAILEYTRDVYILEDDDIADVTKEGIAFYRETGEQVERQTTQIAWSRDSAQKGGYDHFMLKEIFEQPRALRETLAHYVDLETLTIKREAMPFDREQANALEKLTVIACGTAHHAGMIGRVLIETLARVKTETDIASEYRYYDTIDQPGETLIAVSQSGETADTVAAVRKAKGHGSRVVALTNVIGSTIARESDMVMYTLAGPEIAVASTKAYTTQILLFEIIALDLANLRGLLTDEELRERLRELAALPEKAEQVLSHREEVADFAHSEKGCEDVFFIGRLMDYYTSLEAALKLKEVSYIHSEAYAAGELKHGPIALIDDTTLVVATLTQKRIVAKTISNVEEVRARKAKILLVASESIPLNNPQDTVWRVPDTDDLFSPILMILYVQMFAYYMALQKGCDIDKPRNLAKSVTVE